MERIWLSFQCTYAPFVLLTVLWHHCLLCYLCSGSQNIPQLGKIFFANFRWGLLYFQTTSTGIKNGIFTQQVDLINHGLNRQRAEENEMDGIPFAERSLTYKELTDLNTVTHSLQMIIVFSSDFRICMLRLDRRTLVTSFGYEVTLKSFPANSHSRYFPLWMASNLPTTAIAVLKLSLIITSSCLGLRILQKSRINCVMW